MTAQVRELLLRVPASPETDELQNLCELILKERKEMLRTIESQKQAMQKVREVLYSAASNRRFMQIAGPARQCLNILNPFFPT